MEEGIEGQMSNQSSNVTEENKETNNVNKQYNSTNESKKLERKERPKNNDDKENSNNKKQCHRLISESSYTSPHIHFWSLTNKELKNEKKVN